MKTNGMTVQKLYQSVTNAVIAQLEEGTPPWVRPWRDERRAGIGMVPSNLATGRLYSGGNILLLWMASQAFGYPHLQYCTYKQANEMGAKVRKGEKAHHVIFTKRLAGEDDDGKEKVQTIVKTYPVFNVAQLDDVPSDKLAPQAPPADVSPWEDTPRAALLKGCGVKVEHGGNVACYVPSQDLVRMPNAGQFHTADDYWQTLFHELTHATAHEKRCGRKFGKRFGDEQYAFEELVAELGSAFLCARTGIPAGYRSASYLDSWLKVLKQDNRAILSAASYAGQGSDFLWDQAHAEQQEEEGYAIAV